MSLLLLGAGFVWLCFAVADKADVRRRRAEIDRRWGWTLWITIPVFGVILGWPILASIAKLFR